jgi:hypothetical protein
MDTIGLIDLVGHRETWEERLHRIKKAMVNELGMEKYRCPYRWCCGGDRPILRVIIKKPFSKTWS